MTLSKSKDIVGFLYKLEVVSPIILQLSVIQELWLLVKTASDYKDSEFLLFIIMLLAELRTKECVH